MIAILLTFYSQGTYLVKVVAVQVGIDPEQSSGDGLDDISEVTRKWHAYIPLISGYPPIHVHLRTNLVREDRFVVQKTLGPVHKRIDIVWSRKFGRSLVLDTILPEVLKSAFK
jgi:hypothetical protein